MQLFILTVQWFVFLNQVLHFPGVIVPVLSLVSLTIKTKKKKNSEHGGPSEVLYVWSGFSFVHQLIDSVLYLSDDLNPNIVSLKFEKMLSWLWKIISKNASIYNIEEKEEK